MIHILAALLTLCLALPAYAGWADAEVSGYVPKYAHLTARDMVPGITNISGATAAARTGSTPHDRMRFDYTGNPTAYFYFTYPRNADLNRFEIAVEGQSTVNEDFVCLRAAYMVTNDGQTWSQNLGGTGTSGGQPDLCGGDCDGDGTVTTCEAAACEYMVTNGKVPYPGNGGSCSGTGAATCGVCDLNNDGVVSTYEYNNIRTSYLAYGCPQLPWWEGSTIDTSEASAGRNLYGNTDLVRAYKQSGGLCPSGSNPQDFYADGGERINYCSGLPGVIAIQRYNDGCAENANGPFDVQTIHVKYYALP